MQGGLDSQRGDVVRGWLDNLDTDHCWLCECKQAMNVPQCAIVMCTYKSGLNPTESGNASCLHSCEEPPRGCETEHHYSLP